MSKFYTDRTRSVMHQRCPRSRWWGYEYADRGVASTRLALPLAVGIFTHRCLEEVFNYIAEHDQQIPPRETMREIFRQFWVEWETFAATRGFNLSPSSGEDRSKEQNEYLTMREQGSLIEGMVWGYWHEILPQMLQEYEIVEVEHEESPYEIVYEVYWQAKADALLKRKMTGQDIVLSIKTAANYDRRKANEGYIDMQGTSEVWAIEQRLGRQMDGVLMHYLLKGSVIPDSGAGGRMAQYSPLVRGYRSIKGQESLDDVLMGTQGAKKYYWRWEWEENGSKKRLHYKTCESVRMWSDESPLTIEQWVDMLAEGRVQPEAGMALTDQYVTPEIFYRDPQRIEDWKQSIESQEKMAKIGKDKILATQDKGDFQEANRLLNIFFPRYTHSCNYPSRCPFWELCHEPVGTTLASEANPFSHDGFMWREAHHKGEEGKHNEND